MFIGSALFTEIQMSVLQGAEVVVKRASPFFVELTFAFFSQNSLFCTSIHKKPLYFL